MPGTTAGLCAVLLGVAIAVSPLACGGEPPSDEPLVLDDAVPRRTKTDASASAGRPRGEGSTTSLDPVDGGRRDASDASPDAREAEAPPAPGPVAPACVLDTRAVYMQDGRKLESITAYGRYWSRELKNGTSIEGVGFPRLVVDEAKFASGPCAGKPSCVLDTRVVWFDGGAKTESTTANGTSWSWTFDSQGAPVAAKGFPQPLTATTAFRDGPCAHAGGGTCTFDTRTIEVLGASKVETITAYGRWFEYALAADLSRTPRIGGQGLASIPRLVSGPCKDQSPGDCALDTRTVYTDFDGRRTEEITARGRLWAYRLNAAGELLSTITDGVPLVNIARLAGPCAH